MHHVRSFAFNAVLWGAGAVLSIWCTLFGRHFRNGILRTAQLWTRISLWALRSFCGVSLEVRGLENLPAEGCVIAAQHQSALDILLWISLLPAPAFVFKKELKRIPLFGALLEPSGMISVDRSGGRKALRDMVERAHQAVAAGRQVVIFPEGTRVAPGVRGELRHGIAAMAQGLSAPLLPATTDSGLRWGRKSFQKSPGQVHITIHPAILPGLSREELLATLTALFYG
ncbi:lysophospholipid acyltransferase family protein [Acidocella facilis]|uniref:lysophospholipid acyltransferase family protein n=1 Tax=Acidocella facilis TaxID=525 RepID=UPI00047E6B38|nr:lysophospholipid acyltransferase family protein [Acidocella facilis]